MKTKSTDLMTILPQMRSTSDRAKGIMSRFTVLNAEGTKTYAVTCRDQQWACSCPAWKFHSPRQDCKHIHAVRAGRTPALFPLGAAEMPTAAHWL
jgi:hypothetical protein